MWRILYSRGSSFESVLQYRTILRVSSKLSLNFNWSWSGSTFSSNNYNCFLTSFVGYERFCCNIIYSVAKRAYSFSPRPGVFSSAHAYNNLILTRPQVFTEEGTYVSLCIGDERPILLRCPLWWNPRSPPPRRPSRMMMLFDIHTAICSLSLYLSISLSLSLSLSLLRMALGIYPRAPRVPRLHETHVLSTSSVCFI